MNRILVIARLTFKEALRKKLLLMALVAGLAFLILFGVATYFQAAGTRAAAVPPLIRKQSSLALIVVGMYAANFLSVAITVLASVDTLSGEIASGAIQAIATKPIHRWELFCGKWLGFSGMLTIYIGIMMGGVDLASFVATGVVVDHLLRGYLLIWLESALLLSTTLCLSVWLSTLTTGVTVLGLHGLAFLGGWLEQAGTLTQTKGAVFAGIVASLIMPSEAMWRRAAFEMQSPITTAINFTPFSAASVPSRVMVGYAACYAAMAIVIGIRRFSRRDL